MMVPAAQRIGDARRHLQGVRPVDKVRRSVILWRGKDGRSKEKHDFVEAGAEGVMRLTGMALVVMLNVGRWWKD